MGYHGSNNATGLAKGGYFKPGQLYVTSSYENAAKYAGPNGRIFAAYVPRQNLAGMSARHIPKINLSSGVDELPINVPSSKSVRAFEVNASGGRVSLDDVYLAFGLTNEQYHQQLLAKTLNIRQ